MIKNDKRPILFFEFVTHFGGSNKSTIALLNELNKQYDVAVLDTYGCCKEYIDELEKRGIAYDIILPEAEKIIIGGGSPIERLWRMLGTAGQIWHIIKLLRRKLKEINPQLIWLNSEKSMFCVGRAVGKQFPTLIFIRGKHAKLKWYCLKDWKNLSLIVANNSESLKFFQRFNWTKDKLAVAYNGIDFDATQRTGPAPKSLPGQSTPLRVVMPATLIPLKAHSVAIKGFAKFCQDEPDAVLWICGDIPNELADYYFKRLLALRHELGMDDKIHFLGWCSDVPAIIRCADIMLLTSETEGLPRSMLEAMALGKPVIATSAGGIPEVIRNGIEGILIDVGDDNAVTEALQKLKNPNIRRKMGYAGQQRVKSEFSIKRQADDFLRCVKKIVHNHRKG